MAVQTAVQTSILQKILAYFERAAAIGQEVPEKHVQAISSLIELLVEDLSGKNPFAVSPAVPVGPTPAAAPSSAPVESAPSNASVESAPSSAPPSIAPAD